MGRTEKGDESEGKVVPRITGDVKISAWDMIISMLDKNTNG
jgi:hypothetical protein